MKRLGIILGLIYLITHDSCGQDDPLTLAKTIFAKQKFADIDKHITGEYSGRPDGTDLPISSTTVFELLDKNDNAAVVAMTIIDSTGSGFDTYLHFVNDNVWKVTAIRALAVTGIYSEIVTRYENMTQPQRDSLNQLQEEFARISGDSYTPKSIEWTVRNAKLLLSSDRDLIEYFNTNKVKFEAIKDELLAKGFLVSSKNIEEFDDSKRFQQEMDDLLISSIVRSGSSSSENLEFIIGGMIDNSVGYIYVKNKKNKPSMTPNSYIMIREIGNGWYLFKTT